MKRWIAILIVCALSVGCTRQLEVVQESRRIISPADFEGESIPVASPTEDVFIQDSVITDVAEIELKQLELAVEESVLMPTRVGTSVVVESLVGQVNGRPIFANEILEPIADQLLILSEEEQRDITAFKNGAKQLINNQMLAVVKSELLLSEAKSGMTLEENQGLFAYLQREREDMASSAGGSQSAVTRQLLDEEGQTVDEYLDFKQQQVLIEKLLREKVSPHVQVTWRDVKRAWEQNKDKLNVPGKVTLGMIRITGEEEIELVTESFARGESFKVVATNAGMQNDGIWDSFDLDEQGMAGIDVADSIKPHLIDLIEGEVVGPIHIGSSTFWFTIIEIVEAQTASIWDPQVQLFLRERLYGIQSMTEEKRFLERILAEGSYDEFNAMVERILHVAVTRYMH